MHCGCGFQCDLCTLLYTPQGLEGAPIDRFEFVIKQFQKLVSWLFKISVKFLQVELLRDSV